MKTVGEIYQGLGKDKMIITIPGALPGLNEVNNANRSNKYQGAKMKREIDRRIQWTIRSQCKETFQKIKVSFKWYEPNRRRDFDNVASAKKFILDAMVKAEVIPNDGWKNIHPTFSDEFYLDKADPRIEVTIERIK